MCTTHTITYKRWWLTGNEKANTHTLHIQTHKHTHKHTQPVHTYDYSHIGTYIDIRTYIIYVQLLYSTYTYICNYIRTYVMYPHVPRLHTPGHDNNIRETHLQQES